MLSFLKVKLQFDKFCRVNSRGQLGGLGLFWKADLNVRLLNTSAHFIDVEIGGMGDDDHWQFTGFYGYLGIEERSRVWQTNLQSHGWWVKTSMSYSTCMKKKGVI